MNFCRSVPLFIITLATGLSSVASAATHYIDPIAGSSAGDGTAGNPWQTLQQVVEMQLIETRHWSVLPYAPGATLQTVNPNGPVKAGDVILLGAGYHGELVLNGAYNVLPITIEANPAAASKPQLSRIVFRGASGWHVKGVAVSPSFGGPQIPTIVDIVSHDFHGPTDNVEVEGCDIFTVPDISAWSAADWIANAVDGVITSGDDIIIRDNDIKNIRFGISSFGLRALVTGNQIRNFSGDGLRGLGDFNVFEYNYIANSYDVDENHDDGFQSWSVGPEGVGSGVVTGVIVRGNFILNREDPNQPLSGPLQGIGGFDGFFNDWIIENNVVVVDHFHGITLTGSRNAIIRNNTVLDFDAAGLGPPWIKITPHKDGRPGVNNTVRNNLTTAIANDEIVTEDHNMIIDDPFALFVNPALPWDLHLLPTAAAIDQGLTEASLLLDKDLVARPQGAATDIGAYEWVAATPGTDAGFQDTGFEDVGIVDAGGDVGAKDSGFRDSGERDFGSSDPDVSAVTEDSGPQPIFDESSPQGGCNTTDRNLFALPFFLFGFFVVSRRRSKNSRHQVPTR